MKKNNTKFCCACKTHTHNAIKIFVQRIELNKNKAAAAVITDERRRIFSTFIHLLLAHFFLAMYTISNNRNSKKKAPRYEHHQEEEEENWGTTILLYRKKPTLVKRIVHRFGMAAYSTWIDTRRDTLLEDGYIFTRQTHFDCVVLVQCTSPVNKKMKKFVEI